MSRCQGDAAVLGIEIMEALLFAKDVTEAWEDEGGALSPTDCRLTAEERLDPSLGTTRNGPEMTGTVNQVEWAEQIKVRVSAEFDRVAKAFQSVADKQTEQDRRDTLAVIAILEEKRAEVMARNQAGYFIHDWQAITDQVRQMIAQDSRYQVIKANRAARRR